MAENIYHIPVLFNEVIDLLNVKPGGKYIDATLGGGGHSEGVLKKGGLVLGLDADNDAIEEANRRFKNYSSFRAVKSNFALLKEVAGNNGFSGVDGILFDLGVSTHQLETRGRGFSFNSNASLDMRMDQNLTVTARDLVNGLNEGELAELILKLGEDNYAKKIAREIVKTRMSKPLETCDELANVVLKVRPRGKSDRTHPATRTFQALRVAVNDELNSLKDALSQAVDLLKPAGRLIVISFHSLEDRIVKNYFRDLDQKTAAILTAKPIVPKESEIMINPHSRSAKLRAIEKSEGF